MASRGIHDGVYLHDVLNVNPGDFCEWAREASVFWARNAQGLSMVLSRYVPGLWTEMQRVERQALIRGRDEGEAMLMRMAELSAQYPIPVQVILKELYDRGQGPLRNSLLRITLAYAAQPAEVQPVRSNDRVDRMDVTHADIRTPTAPTHPVRPPAPPTYEEAMGAEGGSSRTEVSAVSAAPMTETKSVAVDPSVMLQHLDTQKFAMWTMGGGVFLGEVQRDSQPRWVEFVKALDDMTTDPDAKMYYAAARAAQEAHLNRGSQGDAVWYRLRDSHKISLQKCVTVLQRFGGHELALTLAAIPQKR